MISILHAEAGSSLVYSVSQKSSKSAREDEKEIVGNKSYTQSIALDSSFKLFCKYICTQC